jgi:phosphoribosylformylglycinamidine synthase
VKATVLVRPKQGILDPQGEATRGALQKLGFHVEETRVGRVFDLEVTSTDRAAAKAEIEQMCERLLANPLIESYEIELVG